MIAIAQTPDGYLWVGTNGGLARFDGARFTVFDRRSTPELASDQCGPFLLDGSGALWIGTMGGGLTRYADGRFTSYGPREGATFEYIISMIADADGRLWLGTNDRLHVWDGKRFKAFGPDDGVTMPRPMPILVDAQNRVWLTGLHGEFGYFQNGAFHASAAGEELVPSRFARPVRPIAGPRGSMWIIQSDSPRLTRWDGTRDEAFDLAPSGPVDAIGRVVEGRFGDVWVGMRESGLRLIRGGHVTSIGTADGLPAGPIAALMADREGNVWVGNSGGLTRIKPRSFSALGAAGGLERERTWAVYEDRRGDLWIGTDSVAWRLSEGRLTRFGPAGGLPANGVTSFVEDGQGTLWVGSTGGLARFDRERLVPLDPSQKLRSDNIRALARDRAGRVWIGTAAGATLMDHGAIVRSYTSADGLAGDWVRYIHEDATGDVWLATTSGLSRLHEGRFTTFLVKDGLADDRVLAIHETHDGALWFGTYRGGLSRYKNGRFATVARAAGLHDDTVLRILEDDRGAFWMSSPHGVFRAARKDLDDVADGKARALTSISYDKTDGLPTTDCGGGTQPAGWRARDGRLWFPTGRGITVVDPARVRVNALPPAVRIEEVLYDRVHSGGTDGAVLPAGSKTVEIHYTATLLGAPDRVRFRYRLEPFDSDWVDAGSRRIAYFTALRPGRYRFHVTAANESGVWNPAGAVYDLRVKPHAYETPAFFAAVALLLSLSGWGAYRLRVKQIEARYAAVLSERGRIARELHDTIAQGFTGVSMQLEAASAKLSGAPDDVKDNLDRARILVKTSLSDARRSVRALRPHVLESGDLAESLRTVVTQLTAGTDVRASVRTRGPNKRLPLAVEDTVFRIGQEAMTNAVRHGGCRSLTVDLDVASGLAVLTVSDDGNGFDPAAAKEGSGLSGMRERAAQAGGSIEVVSAPGAGTSLIASIPVRSRAEDRA